ncbi:4-hydroxyphenylpyruvate dioxygenase family protein [Paraburkholderia acidisoli]|uniref:4-hydroxyphenylpyruvate dioxygenase n=1 Tax=Paraburkholderia acidisoli TaxID=2571748 RepID=A0A7Z2GRB4_9BURK|nr:VOC family protein [Paraburkholderia acidisoli]QGZ66450.1 4-hydroxyphenylpyruvate dioxygenase [Paraburkholderia acidisoli]
MTDTPFDPNPLGIRGLDFVEFATPDPEALARLFTAIGFRALARHRSKAVTLYRQGDINFLINAEPDTFASRFADVNGLGVVAIGMRVAHAKQAYSRAIQWGAWRFDHEQIGPHELRIPAIQGIGHSLIYFVEHWRGKTGTNESGVEPRMQPSGESVFDVDFLPQPGIDDVQAEPEGCGLKTIDHFTQVVSRGTLAEWKDFYRSVLHFSELPEAHANWHVSQASSVIVSPGNLIRIPVYEEGAPRTAVMHRYLHEHATDGVQHVALATHDIFATVDLIRREGLEFVQPPAGYYAQLDARLPGHGLDVAALQQRHILVDGDTSQPGAPRLLLQTFVRRGLGEMALEIIERRGDTGFGEGNLVALEQARVAEHSIGHATQPAAQAPVQNPAQKN